MKTLKELNEELDAFNATLNDENEDTPELLAEQERLLNAIIAAEAADLGRAVGQRTDRPLRISALPGNTWRKGLSKAALIAKIKALPPLMQPTRRRHPPLPSPRPSASPHMPLRMASTGASYAKNCAPVDCALRTPLSRSRKWWEHERRHRDRHDDRQHRDHLHLGYRV